MEIGRADLGGDRNDELDRCNAFAPDGEGYIAFFVERCGTGRDGCIRLIAGPRRPVTYDDARAARLMRIPEPPADAYVADDGIVRCRECAQRSQDETERRNRRRRDRR